MVLKSKWHAAGVLLLLPALLATSFVYRALAGVSLWLLFLEVMVLFCISIWWEKAPKLIKWPLVLWSLVAGVAAPLFIEESLYVYTVLGGVVGLSTLLLLLLQGRYIWGVVAMALLSIGLACIAPYDVQQTMHSYGVSYELAVSMQGLWWLLADHGLGNGVLGVLLAAAFIILVNFARDKKSLSLSVACMVLALLAMLCLTVAGAEGWHGVASKMRYGMHGIPWSFIIMGSAGVSLLMAFHMLFFWQFSLSDELDRHPDPTVLTGTYMPAGSPTPPSSGAAASGAGASSTP